MYWSGQKAVESPGRSALRWSGTKGLERIYKKLEDSIWKEYKFGNYKMPEQSRILLDVRLA